jgi:LysM repeat protein
MVTIAVNVSWREIARESAASRRNGLWRSAAIGIVLFWISGCGALEPIAEPELSDIELTVDTLKSSLRDAQRTIVELRTEGDARREELADAQIARAQLEGHVREAERRLIEARHVIDLQREELASSRSARERMGRTGITLQSQQKQRAKQLSWAGEHVKGEASSSTMVSPLDGHSPVTTVRVERDSLPAAEAESTRVLAQPAVHMQNESSVGEVPILSQSSPTNSSTHVLIKPGDTLWGIGRRFHVRVDRLMAINALVNDRIRVGQTLRLTESSTGEPARERM